MKSGLKAIADASFDSVMITSAGRKNEIIYVNKAFEKLTG